MSKHKSSNGAPERAGRTAECACSPADEPHTARAGVGPGAHAAGVDPGIKAANLRHLRRIEGQVRGIAAMVEDDRYCADIIQQAAAAQESLRSVAKNLLRNHLAHCAAAAMQAEGPARDNMIEEILELVGKVAR